MGLYCFGKNFRLLKKTDFDYLQTDSRRIKSNHFFVVAKDSRVGAQETRIGISVSKKIGNSCWRNTVKRMIRESFRQSGIKFNGLDLLFVALPGLKANQEKSLALMKKDFQFILRLIKKNERHF